MNSATHPVWKLADRLLIFAFAAFSMWLFCNQFDETEAKSLAVLAGGLFAPAGIAGILALLKFFKGEAPPQT